MTPRALSVAGIHAAVTRWLDGRHRRLAVIRGGLLVAVILAAAWALAGLGADGASTPVPLVLDLVLLGGGGVAAWRWWRERERLLDEAAVARGMERAAELPEGLVRGSLELGRSRPAGVSPGLVARGEAHLAGRLDRSVPELAGARGAALTSALRRSGRGLALAVPVVALLAVLGPDRAREGWGGLLSPVARFTGPALPPLVVQPGDVELVRGAELEVRIDAPGRETVTLHWQAAGDVARSAELAVADGRARHPFGAVTAGMVYRVDAPDGASAGEFTVTPRDPLFVTDVAVRLAFPPYTGRLPEEYRGDVPPLQLPVGTRLLIEGQGSRPLASARLEPVALDSAGVETPRPGPAVELPVEGSRFTADWGPRSGGAWAWRFEDTSGGAAELRPRPLDLTLIPDGPPSVAITFPPADTTLPLDLRQPLVLQAADDYGVAALELVAWRVTALGEVREPVTQRLDMGDARVVLARPLMDVSSWGLLPGDQVRYYARSVDNGPLAQEARTPEFVLRMPGAQELRRNAGDRLDEAAAELEALAEQARRAAEETRDLERQARAPDRPGDQEAFEPGQESSVGFEEREGLQAALEEQREMAAQVDSLGRELGRMSETLSEAGAQDEGLRRDLADLEDLLEELGGEEMRQRLDELAERMDDMDRREARQALEDLASQEEDFRERLEEALERMKRAAAQQDFRATAQEAEELAERQRALAESLAEDPSAERADQQEALQQEAEAMDESMESLAERLRELGEDQAAEGVEQARQDAQEAASSMQDAARQARNGEGEQAAQQGRQAAAEMDEAAREMMQAQQEMMQERARAFQQALEQTSQDALSLARRQGEIREAMQGATTEEMAGLRAEAASVEQGLRNMAENLAIAAQASQAGGGERPVSEALGQAMAAVDRVVDALDRPSGRTLSPQAAAEQAVDAMNEVALQSLAAARQLSEGGSASSSPEQMQEQLEQLAQQQADVNNEASQMMPMQLTPQAQQQQMEQLAQQQQEVASNVGEMANQEGEDGPLGDLEALAQEAQALAQELAGGRLDAETRERQERLFHRLLDAGRSLEKEEFSEERESEGAGLVERGEVAPLGPDALGLLRFRPDAEALRRLPPAARALVIRYFERLNGEGGGPPPVAPPAAGGAGGGRP